ncbi:hypothetical protein SLL00_16525 [Metabacillus indicus]|uniref:hypothetical protein n=1 Tax=Metabacillus indicus TaxID=246786 RepID=UPI002A0551A9|nr:hypothetical protein [Metabacillus indicus]MDX8291417.1 hypothetical protein [Metabacillus indicus]
MEKTIVIDGKEVRLRSTAATPIRYKAQFGKDFFNEILSLGKNGKVKEDGSVDIASIESIDFDLFYNFTWVLAKTADKSIADPITWLDQFEQFPLVDVISETQDLLTHSIQGKKK